MGDYDITLKSLFYRKTRNLFEQLIGSSQVRWMNTEFIQNKPALKYVDLLAETVDGELIHFEFQSANDVKMPCREMEYSAAIYRVYERFPTQIVMYVGEASMQMTSFVEANGFRFQLVDIRDLNGTELLDSPELEDNVLAILTRGFDNRETLRTVLSRIAESTGERRSQAIEQLATLAKLRKLEITLKQEVAAMPITIDIREHLFYTEGFEKGVEQGQRGFLKHMLEKRFGPLSDSVDARLEGLSTEQMEALGTRLFQCETLDEAFHETLQ